MKRKATNGKQLLVSPIVQTVDGGGRNMLGFTVYFHDGSFYNVLSTYGANEYAKVMAEISEKRAVLLQSQNSTEDFR